MVKTILDNFCVKSGIFCSRCEEKVRKGQISDLDVRVIRSITELEKENPPLSEVTFHKAVEAGDIMALMVDRRGMDTFLASGATSAWPLVAPAQQPAKVGRVSWIWGGPSAGNPIEAAGFRQGLKELGYIEGRDVVVDYRFGEGRIDRLTDLVGELVQFRPDVLVALGDLTARAVKSVTTDSRCLDDR